MEDPKLAKGIVKREVVRVFTPGLVTDAIQLGNGENNYLMGFRAEGEVFGLAFLDISTGELKACHISGLEPFLSEGLRNEPKEILSLKRFQEHPCFEEFKKNFGNGLITFLDDLTFDAIPSFNEMEQNTVIQKAPLAAQAVSMVLHYAEENQKKPICANQPIYHERRQ